MRTEVVLKDIGVGGNGAKTCVAWEYSLAWPRIKLWIMCFWVGGSCWVGGIEFKLVVKAWAHKRIPPIGFPNQLLKSIWIKSSFPYSQCPPFKGAKQNTIGVIGGAYAKLPYHKGPMSTYLMDKKCYLYIMLQNGRDVVV
jgi:hypothetical protein